MRTLILGLLLFAVGCEKPPTPPKPYGMALTGARQIRLTSTHEALVEWVSQDARVIAFWVFDSDTNNDGRIEVKLGEHGENEGDTPTFKIVDTHTSKTIDADDALAYDPARRFVVFRKGAKVSLLNAASGQISTLENVNLEPDYNGCERHRSVSFDATGRRIGWVSMDGALVTRDVNGGAERLFEAQDGERIWRAELTWHPDWVVLQTVDGAFPKMKTSCHVRWSRGFARSQGNYGWDRTFRTELVGLNLRRDLKTRLLPLSANILVDLDSQQLESADASALNIPRKVSHIFAGSEVVVRAKETGLALWNARTGDEHDMVGLRFGPKVTALYAGREPWVAVQNSNREAARLNLLTGQVDVGPQMGLILSEPHISGWWVFPEISGELVAWDLNSGHMTRASLPGVVEVDGLAVRVASSNPDEAGWYVLDPGRDRFARVPFRPVWVASNGCSVPQTASGLIREFSIFCP